jgi:hypothetical protein
MIHDSIHRLLRGASPEQVELALEDATAFFWVDWNEDDDQIPGLCEAVLKTGDVAAAWDDDSLWIARRGQRYTVTLTRSLLTSITNSWVFTSVYWMLPFVRDLFYWPSRGDRHTTILAVNRALQPDYEIRYVTGSADGEAAAFAPLAAEEWATLESQYGEGAVGSKFAALREEQNVFLEEFRSWSP